MQFDKNAKVQYDIISKGYLIYKARALMSNDNLTYLNDQRTNIYASTPYIAYQNAISERSNAIIEDGIRAMIIGAPPELDALNTTAVTMERCYSINILSTASRSAAAAKRVWHSEMALRYAAASSSSYSRASWKRSMMQLADHACVGQESPQNSPFCCVSSVNPAQGLSCIAFMQPARRRVTCW
jgi:hypothetical protein